MTMDFREQATASLRDAIGTLHRPFEEKARIVSLVPSLTELVCELGLAGELVGRTGFCVHPRETVRQITKVGGTKDVRIEAVRALEPTHVIVNIDENTRETVDALADFVPNIIVTHPCEPEDNFNLYRLLGGIFGRASEADALAGRLVAILEEGRRVCARREPEAVLYLIWRAPWMTVSPQTYIAAMLARVGWISLPASASARYPEVDWRAPWVADARRIFLSSEPFRFRQCHMDEVRGLSQRPVEMIDGEMVSWYGSRAIAGMRYLIDLRERLAGDAPTSPGTEDR